MRRPNLGGGSGKYPSGRRAANRRSEYLFDRAVWNGSHRHLFGLKKNYTSLRLCHSQVLASSTLHAGDVIAVMVGVENQIAFTFGTSLEQVHTVLHFHSGAKPGLFDEIIWLPWCGFG
jgi:hypothetical protein